MNSEPIYHPIRLLYFQKDAMQDLKADLLAKWNNVLAPIRGLMNVTQPFTDEYKAIMDLFKRIKVAYGKLKEV